jgi:DNA-binding CsgD family transcriptional regulator
VRCTTQSAPEAGSGGVWTPGSGGAMLISRQPPKRPLQLVVTPFQSREILLADRPAALVFLSDPEARSTSRGQLMQQLYRLTQTESRLANLLAHGYTLAEAAEQMEISVDTVRFHLKQIFRKTGTCRQSELMRTILSLPGA